MKKNITLMSFLALLLSVSIIQPSLLTAQEMESCTNGECVTLSDLATNVNSFCCSKSKKSATQCVNKIRRALNKLKQAFGEEFVSESRDDLQGLKANCGGNDSNDSDVNDSEEVNQCNSQCKRTKRASDGFRTGFRYKHSEIPGAGVVALTDEFSKKARFLADNCKVVESTKYFGLANGNRHHYYSAREKSGISTFAGMAKKARKVGSSNRGYFQVGSTCYGPFNMGQELD